MKRLLARLLGFNSLEERLQNLEGSVQSAIPTLRQQIEDVESRMLESQDSLRKRSKQRWVSATPGIGLTWGRKLSGEAFVDKALSNVSLSEASPILELGPGYGRITKAFLGRGLPFERYLAVDLSQNVVEHLRSEILDSRVEFRQGEIEDLRGSGQFELIWSALTFKHIYPSIEKALASLAECLAPNGRVIFDLIEGQKRYFEPDGDTFIRHYSREEVTSFLQSAGLELIAFDSVQHDPESIESCRLLAVAGPITGDS